MGKYDSPGVYIIEKNTLPLSISAVDTAVPVFIGYTASLTDSVTGEDYTNKLVKINSPIDYKEKFGAVAPHSFDVDIKQVENSASPPKIIETKIEISAEDLPATNMHYAIQMYYSNGGGPCYVLSLGTKVTGFLATDYNNVEQILEANDGPTLIVIPDSVLLGDDDHGAIVDKMLNHCNKMQDRFLITDVRKAINESTGTKDNATVTSNFRDKIAAPPASLKYGAAYFPYLETSIDFETDDANIMVTAHSIKNEAGTDSTTFTAVDTSGGSVAISDDSIKKENPMLYNLIWAEVRNKNVILPPSPAMAGIYCAVDNNENVWVAPANVGISRVVKPTIDITHDFNGDLNVDASGKSVNAIRTFTGRGTIVWGARTLNAADLNWRFINVRRMVIMIETSIKRIMELYVFSPNTANTWVKVQSMITSFLDSIWKEGGLAGAIAQDAFEVNIGLHTTMTPMEVAQGIMNVEIILTPARPAEVIKLIVSQKLQTS